MMLTRLRRGLACLSPVTHAALGLTTCARRRPSDLPPPHSSCLFTSCGFVMPACTLSFYDLCDLKRARERVRGLHGRAWSLAARNRLLLIHYPPDPGLALTSDDSTQLWLGGSAAGTGRFLSFSKVTSFMGIDTWGGVYSVARRLLKECALLRVLCESVPRCMTVCAAHLGPRLLGYPPLQTVGSLYSGAFDALGAAGQDVFHARLSFVAESVGAKTAILLSRSPSHCFSCVENVDASCPADILAALPPCLLYSNRFSRTHTGGRTVPPGASWVL